MIAKRAMELYHHLLTRGFEVKGWQEEDPAKDLDAEVEIGHNIVVQIGYGPSVEYGLTIEPHRQKRANSGFQHVGYYDHVETLVEALKRICPEIPQGTWTSIIVSAVNGHEEFDLDLVYKALENHPRRQSNKNYRAKIRQVLQNEKMFRKTKPGHYAFVKRPHKPAEREQNVNPGTLVPA